MLSDFAESTSDLFLLSSPDQLGTELQILVSYEAHSHFFDVLAKRLFAINSDSSWHGSYQIDDSFSHTVGLWS